MVDALKRYHEYADQEIAKGLAELDAYNKAIADKKAEIPAYVVKGGALAPFTLRMGELTDDEREIILKGCLINYNRR